MLSRSIFARVLAAGACAAVVGASALFFFGQRPASKSDEETDSPDQAHAWRRLGMISESGSVAPGAWNVARKQIAKLASQSSSRGTDGWREAGPFNVAGRTRSILIDPRDTQVMYTGSVGGGIWKTSDGGGTWASLSDRLPNMAIGCMVFNPTNPDIIYAGTGEGYFNSDALGGSGVLKSTDAGENWTIMPATSNFDAVNRIAISPTDSNRMLVATAKGGVMLSVDGGATFTLSHWAQQIHQVIFHPTNGQKALMTVQDYDFTLNQWFTQAYYSTDAGATWTAATGIRYTGYGNRFEVGYAKGSPETIYASTAAGVYRSTNGGVSYIYRGTVGASEQQFWYDNAVWVEPTNSNIVVVAGAYPYRSIDGGASFTKIGNGYILTEQPHPDVHAVVPDPGYDGVNNKTVYLATDGGVHKTTNILTATGSTGWTRYTTDVRTSQFYGAIGDGPTGRFIAGAQDNGTLQMNGNSTQGDYAWGGDGGWCAMDPSDPNYFYGEYTYLQIFRTTNGGGNPNYIFNGDGAANFIAPFILDPNDNNRLLGGASVLYRSNNVKATSPSFANIKSSIGSPISAIAVAPGNSNVIWVGHNNGRVYKTINGTATTPTWTVVDDNSGTNPLPNRYVHRILIDPASSDKAYVSFGGFQSNNLWLTVNGGTTFTQRTGAGANVLPSAPIRALARHPNDENLLYAGTEVGICQSTDGGLNWTAPSTGPINVSVDELRFMNNSTKLLAATHGRGLWVLGPVGVASLTGPSTVAAGATALIKVTLDGIAATGGVDVALSSSSGQLTTPSTVTVSGGQKVATFEVTAGTPSVDTPVTLSATLNGTTQTHNITVQAQVSTSPLASVTVSPTTVAGGTLTIPKVTVTLSGPAPSGGKTVALASSNPTALTVPLTATILSGQSSVIVNASTSSVATNQDVVITGTLEGATRTANITVTPPRPKSVVLSQATVYGGSATVLTATVTIELPAPAGGMSVALSSGSPTFASVPASTTIAGGQTKATFPVTHYAVNNDKAAAIRATSGGLTKGASLSVRTAIITSVTISPRAVIGGSTTVVNGTVNINTAAASAGAAVTLSATPAILTFTPVTVQVPTGQKAANFSLTAQSVSVDTVVTVKATRFGVEQTTTLTVKPPVIISLTLSPTSVVGGSGTLVQGVVTLNGKAPTGGLVVNLSSSSSSASGGVKKTVLAGSKSATFTITHSAVASQVIATITATTGAVSKSKTLTIKP